MHMLNYLPPVVMAASVLAAPGSNNAGLDIRQSDGFNFPAVCPIAYPYDCIANRRAVCISSGLEYCKDGSVSRPSKNCDEFCKAQAQRECGLVGCCPYKEPYGCVGLRRSACLGSGLAVCQGGTGGGPPKPCDDWCKFQAQHECRVWGCCKHCIGERRSFCLGAGHEICKNSPGGGPTKACDDFCKVRAAEDCAAVGCK